MITREGSLRPEKIVGEFIYVQKVHISYHMCQENQILRQRISNHRRPNKLSQQEKEHKQEKKVYHNNSQGVLIFSVHTILHEKETIMKS